MNRAARIRIVIVDDHPVVRHGLRNMLGNMSDFDVIGEADSGASALEVIGSNRPDVVLLDIKMPGQDGIQVARRVRAIAPDTRVVLMTVHDDPAFVARAFEADVHGYLLKSAAAEEVVEAIRRVAGGARVLASGLTTAVLGDYVSLVRGRTKQQLDVTPQEIQILEGMAAGRSYRELAATLFMSEITVRRKVQNVYQKLNVSDRAEAVAVAIRTGLI